jgi:hypothetical protein
VAIAIEDGGDDADDADASGLRDPTLAGTPCGRSANNNVVPASAAARRTIRNNQADSKGVQKNLANLALGAGPRKGATFQLKGLEVRRIPRGGRTHPHRMRALVIAPEPQR